MITINATGDTTLHTAGKYCPEDILVKVPAGGSGGGASVDTCTVKVNVTRGGSVYQNLSGYTYTAFVDGNYTPRYFQQTQLGVSDRTLLDSVTLNDVLCGSIITLNFTRDWNWWVFSMDNAENLQFG